MTGSYDTAFLCAGIPPFIGALLMLPILRHQRQAAVMMTSTATSSTNGTVCTAVSGDDFCKSMTLASQNIIGDGVDLSDNECEQLQQYINGQSGNHHCSHHHNDNNASNAARNTSHA